MQFFRGEVALTGTYRMVTLCLFLISLLFTSVTASAYYHSASPAKPQKAYPNGCRPVGFEFSFGKLVLRPVREEDYNQTLYLIHNVSAGRITVKFDRSHQNPLYPLWQTRIGYNRWAAFATDKEGLSFQCYRAYSDGYTSALDCAQVLRVCQYPRAKFAQHNTGSYWISSDRSRRSTVREVIRKGVLLRW